MLPFLSSLNNQHTQHTENTSDTHKEHATRGTMNTILPVAKWIIIWSCYLLLMCIFKWSLFVCVHFGCVCVLLPFWRSARRTTFIQLTNHFYGYWMTQEHQAHVIFCCLNITEIECVPRRQRQRRRRHSSHFSFAISVCSLACLPVCLLACFYYDDLVSVCVAFLIRLELPRHVCLPLIMSLLMFQWRPYFFAILQIEWWI